MSNSCPPAPPDRATPVTPHALHQHFVEILPRVEAHARMAFRAIRCPHSRDDAVAEVLGLAWRQYLRYCERGVDPARFPRLFARRIVGSVNGGRRTARQDRRDDLLSPRAHLHHGIKVLPLGDWSESALSVWGDTLAHDARTPVADQAAFRVDFPAWLETLKPRFREVVARLLAGEKSCDVAREMKLNRQYFCRLRAALRLHWLAYQAGSPFRSVRQALLRVGAR